MRQKLFFLLAGLFTFCISNAQDTAKQATSKNIYFVSDTQQPLMIEKLWMKSNHNKQATAEIFASILKEKPASLYMLGDVVGLGYSNRKWKKVDIFLDSCRKNGTDVCGILGNHEVMARKKKGEANFQKRFPMNVKTGYVSVSDSVAVVLLNSNFNKLSTEELKKQKDWYSETLASLDTAAAIKAVIVCCHHAPFTNSKVVKCSNQVQDYFVGDYIKSKKAQLFITGHCHAFEHFKMQGKDFIVIGGGGGLNQPLSHTEKSIADLAIDYKPAFHYLSVKRVDDKLTATSHYISEDFKSFNTGYSFSTNVQQANLAQSKNVSAEELKKN